MSTPNAAPQSAPNSNDKVPGETVAKVLNDLTEENTRLKERNEALANAAMRLEEMDKHQQRLVELCETADPAELATRAHDLHRLNFLIHHAERIVIGAASADGEPITIEGEALLQLRATLDALRKTHASAKPKRTLRTET